MKTKGRVIAVFIIISLLLPLFVTSVISVSDGMVIAVNDEIIDPPKGVNPVIKDGIIYVPLEVFTNYLSCNYSYDGIANALTISKGSRTVYFNININIAIDYNNNVHSATAYYGTNTFMVPAEFTASILGLKYSYIGMVPIVRIYSNSSSLSDSDIYKKYLNIINPPQPSNPDGQTNASSKDIYLVFDQSPNSNTDSILDKLESRNANAAFFVSEENIYNSPLALVDIVAKQHTVGISVPQDAISAGVDAVLASINKTNDALMKVVKFKSRIVLLEYNSSASVSTQMRDAITNAGYRIWGYTIDSGDSSGTARYSSTIAANTLKAINSRSSTTVVRFSSTKLTAAAVSSLLSSLSQSHNNIIRKIAFLSTPINVWNDHR